MNTIITRRSFVVSERESRTKLRLSVVPPYVPIGRRASVWDRVLFLMETTPTRGDGGAPVEGFRVSKELHRKVLRADDAEIPPL